jgi:hypothetical protein
LTIIDKQNDLFLCLCQCAGDVAATEEYRAQTLPSIPILYIVPWFWLAERHYFFDRAVHSTLSAMDLRILKTLYFLRSRAHFRQDLATWPVVPVSTLDRAHARANRPPGNNMARHGGVWIINTALFGPILASTFMTRIAPLTELLLHFGHAVFQPRVS